MGGTSLGDGSPASVDNVPSAAPTPHNVDVAALYDDFEARFPGTNWIVSDSDPAADEDLWGYSNHRSFAGTGSVWSSGTGNQTRSAILVDEDFEGDTSNWDIEDRVGSYGLDHWGSSTYRAHAGNSSLWCAQVGTQTYQGTEANNSFFHKYDHGMDAYATVSVNLTGLSTVTLEYWYLSGSHSSDYFRVGYYSSQWIWLNSKSGGGVTDTTPWTYVTLSIPTNATKIGFYFYSNDWDSSGEGAYVDDIVLSGAGVDANSALHTYDTNQTATMYRGVDVSDFGAARVDYQYWLETEAPNDTLEVMYYADGIWSYADVHSGSSGGWKQSSVSIPLTTTFVGFRFVSDGEGHLEGAYIDELRVMGVVLPLRCQGSVDRTDGYEVVTPFNFSSGLADGRGPFDWTWQFGDGTTSALQNPSHPYNESGTYTISLSVRDSVGQTCSAQVGTVTVYHDVTKVSVTPRTSNVVEGRTIALLGADGQGHPYQLNWSVDPPNCGAFNSTLAANVTFTIANTSGGLVCTVAAWVADAYGYSTLTVEYDTSVIHIDPPSGTVPEGKALKLVSTDRYGNVLSVLWSTSCGRLTKGSGNETVFQATTLGGTACTVTATYGTDRATAAIVIIHDSSEITVEPTSATVVAGASVGFSVKDVYDHPFSASWSVEPPECGSFDSPTGSTNNFVAARSAGGTTCTILVSSELSSTDVPVTVLQDTRTLTLRPRSATLVEGGSQMFEMLDANGYPVVVNWTLSPYACGVLTNTSGLSTTFVVDISAAGLSCKVTGKYGSTGQLAPVTVTHGSPTAITITPSMTSPPAGSTMTLSASAKDAAGHALTDLVISWSATCGAVSPTTGSQVSLSVLESAAGTSCTVTAVSGNTTGTATLAVGAAGALIVTVTPSTISGSGPQTLTASVKDSRGQAVPDAQIEWSASCGELSQTTGSTTVFTPPASAGSEPCAVTAAVAGTGGESKTTVTVAGPSASILPAVAVVVIAGGAGAVGFLLWRKRKQGEPSEGAPTPEYAGEASPYEAPVEEQGEVAGQAPYEPPR